MTKWYKSVSERLDNDAEQALEQLKAFISFVKKMLDKSSNEPIADTGTFKQFRRLFVKGKSCPKCKSRQTWYAADSPSDWRQANINNNLEAVIGESTVQLMGVPAAEKNITDPLAPFTTREIYKTNVSLESLACWHLRKAENLNILYIEDVTELQPGVFSIMEEQFDGTPLSSLLEAEISKKDFQDFILQLCDALAFLHSYNPRIAHNAIFPENILIGEGNLLKLAHFDEAAVGGALSGDIIMAGELMQSIDADYMKKYQKVIDSYIDGTYKTIDDLRQDFMPYSIKSPTVLFILSVIAFALLFIMRRVL